MATADEASPGSGDVVGVAARIVATALAGLVMLGAATGWTWLGGQTYVVAAFALAAAVAVWTPWSTRFGAICAGVAALIGGLVASTHAGRRAYGQPLPDRYFHAGMTDRILARDLPPAGVDVALVASATLVLVCVALAILRNAELVRPLRRGGPIGLAAGVAASLAILAAVVGAGVQARAIADRIAEGDAVTATITRRAARLDETAGPERPGEEAWRVVPARSGAEDFAGAVAVPGWDVVLTVSDRDPVEDSGYPDLMAGTSPVVAWSKRDGSELWRYWRHDGSLRGLTVDPRSGRVLLLAGDAVVVLALADGSEVAARPLPDGLSGAVLVGDRFASAGFNEGAGTTLGPRAVVRDYDTDTMGVLDVADGEVLGTTTVPGGECAYAAVLDGDAPVVVQWGGRACAPFLLDLDGAGFGTTTAVTVSGDRLDDGPGLARCEECIGDQLVVADDSIVVTISGVGYEPSDVVALSSEGAVRWRASETAGAVGRARAQVAGDRSVVAQWDGAFHLLAAADGRELARQPLCGGAYSVASDAARVYVACDDGGAAVLGIDGLDIEWQGAYSFGVWDAAFPADGVLVTARWVGGEDAVAALTA